MSSENLNLLDLAFERTRNYILLAGRRNEGPMNRREGSLVRALPLTELPLVVVEYAFLSRQFERLSERQDIQLAPGCQYYSKAAQGISVFVYVLPGLHKSCQKRIEVHRPRSANRLKSGNM